MKSIVIEQLSQRGLNNIFNEKDFLTYLRKIRRNAPGANNYYVALSIFDMFITNGKI